MVELTDRQKITELISVKPMDAQSLSRAIGISQRAVESHLEHIAKSVGSRFKITPSQCRDCDFIFNMRTRKTKPTKCPKCREEDIMPPLFFIDA